MVNVYKEITSVKDYEALIANNDKVVLKYYGEWCDDCQDMAPHFVNWATTFGDKIAFAKLSVDEHETKDLYKSFHIYSAPTIQFYFKGKLILSYDGDALESIEQWIAHLARGETNPLEDQQSIFDAPVKNVHYDLIVIGGGSGGISAARKAGDRGKKVALIDFVKPSPHNNVWGLGGTCANVGCVPKKLYHAAAKYLETTKEHGSYYGFDVSVEDHHWDRLQKNTQMHINKLNWKFKKALKASNVTYIHGWATLDENERRVVVNNETLTADAILLATGSRPKLPSIPGADLAITSDDIFRLRKRPKHVAIVGGGYIGSEIAGILGQFGTKVTLITRHALLSHFDNECIERVRTSIERSGVTILENTSVASIQSTDEKMLNVTLSNDTSLDNLDYVVMAIGREPSTSSLPVTLNSQGAIMVNAYLETSREQIFACGDACNVGGDLTPVAIQQGNALIRYLYDQQFTFNHVNFIPTTVFTPNEYGFIGLSEKEALSKYGRSKVVVYKKTIRVLEHELNPDDVRVFAKVICLKDQHQTIVGLHYVGPHAGEVVQGYAAAFVATNGKFSKNDLDQTIGIHPTSSEVFTTLVYGVIEDTGCGCG